MCGGWWVVRGSWLVVCVGVCVCVCLCVNLCVCFIDLDYLSFVTCIDLIKPDHQAKKVI